MRHPKRKVIDEVKPAEIDTKWTPLIVIGNKKSGNKDCISILAAFRSQLNPAQVVDLDDCKMEDGLKWFKLLDKYKIKSYCVVAGGDGTIGYVHILVYFGSIFDLSLFHFLSYLVIFLGLFSVYLRSI